MHLLTTSHLPLWRQILSQNFTRLDRLADFLELSAEQRTLLLSKPTFSLNLPRRIAAKMAKSTLSDPLFRQFVPLAEENHSMPGYQMDPVGDVPSRVSAKLLHKYQRRVLLISTGACAMHCRYCFRQNFDYEIKDKSFDREIELIEEDPSITEVILSGGDPLTLTNEVLGDLLERLSQVATLRKVRFHTRFPIGIPERIDAGFLEILRGVPLQIIFVIHANHSRELDEEVLQALKQVRLAGGLMLCQSVLLKGVNDTVETLIALSETLVDNGILPYYLHQLDRVQGTAHFEVEEKRGAALIAEMMKSLPGYAIPRYVREVAGEMHKILLS